MNVKEVTVTNYRNIASAHFEPAPVLTVVCGKNGHGKTNLLESVWLLTGSKSFRGSKDTELVKENENFGMVEGVVSGLGKEMTLRIGIEGTESDRHGRTGSVNGVTFGRATNLAGKFTAVVFEPAHLGLIRGSPEKRRRFIDAALCQVFPSYLSLLRRYTRLVSQKNAALKTYYQNPTSPALIEIYNKDLAFYGTEITLKREGYLELIRQDVMQNYANISNGSEELLFQYHASFTDSMMNTFHASLKRDLAAGFCTTGPHREDFSITLNGRDAKVYASQGQQRSVVLALKLAEATGAYRITNEYPVMLLDDVLSELDDTRQEYLLNRMQGKQIIVTACNAALFSKTNGKIYRMRDGVLSEET
ncbi:MAG: DNA replication/repair protein RecF [Ruthenibacterium sp.]